MGSCCSTAIGANDGAGHSSRDLDDSGTSRGVEEESPTNDSLPPLSARSPAVGRSRESHGGRGDLRQTFVDRAQNKKFLMLMPPALQGGGACDGSAGTGSLGSGELTLRGVTFGTPITRQHRRSSEGSGRHAISSEHETSTTMDGGGADEPREDDTRAMRAVPSARSLLTTRSLNFSATFLSVDDPNLRQPPAEWTTQDGQHNSGELGGSAEYGQRGGSVAGGGATTHRSRRRSDAAPAVAGGNSLSLSGAPKFFFSDASLTASQLMSSSRCSAGGGPRRMVTARPSSFASVLSPEDQERAHAAILDQQRQRHPPPGVVSTEVAEGSATTPALHINIPSVAETPPLVPAPPPCPGVGHSVQPLAPADSQQRPTPTLRRSTAVASPNRASSPLSIHAAPHRQRMHTRGDSTASLSQTAVNLSVVQSVQDFGEFVDEGEYSSSSDPLE